MQAVGLSLLENPSLRSIALCGNRIDDDGAAAFALELVVLAERAVAQVELVQRVVAVAQRLRRWRARAVAARETRGAHARAARAPRRGVVLPRLGSQITRVA